MDENKGTTLAVVLAAMLHLGLVAFLFLATLPCATFERAVSMLGLPDSWNPVMCSKPLSVPGPVIEATLVGPTQAPKPAASRRAHQATSPPPPKVAPPTPKPPPVKTLPPPPERPDVKDQQKVVAQAQAKAEQARREQEERQKQRMSELNAEQEQQKKIDQLFKQLDQAKAQASRAERAARLAAQRKQQLKDLKSAPDAQPDVPEGDRARSGNAGKDDDLLGQYLASVKSAVTQAWLRPDNIPVGVVCKIDIVQIPGGQVLSAKVEPDCPYDEAGRRSVENAVLRAQPLPYKGFEKVFQRQITLNFQVNQ